jgi:hypothetical protein
MRPSLAVLSVLFVVATAVAAGAGPAANPGSASILLHLHPRPWSPPAAPVLGGLRTDVDAPLGPAGTPTEAELATMRAARSTALARIPVQVRPDGSSFAVLGGLVRAYAVVRIGADGRLENGCADSETEALEWLMGPATPTAVTGGK